MIEAIQKDLEKALEHNKEFSGQAIILEQNENSDLVEFTKPPAKEFFEKLFNTDKVFWKTYSQLGLAIEPNNSAHANFIGGKIFFCKNVEKKYLNSIGPIKEFNLNSGKIKEKTPINLENIFLLLASPFEILKQFANVSILSLEINSQLEKYGEFSEKTKKFWSETTISKENVFDVMEKSLIGALKAMEYSFYSSLAYNFKATLKKSKSWQECELEELQKSDAKKLAKDFGFFSENIYDISFPRISEGKNPTGKISAIAVPENPSARWSENCKLLCARYLDLERKAFKFVGKTTGLEELVFFLTAQELKELGKNKTELK
ncbi:MAG: hypothetical protein Q7K42_04700, partial [Candidatus Diapherotrites archaeon]|nr:hypothetical protein [Candidatus Diapherotrites archaeon]